MEENQYVREKKNIFFTTLDIIEFLKQIKAPIYVLTSNISTLDPPPLSASAVVIDSQHIEWNDAFPAHGAEGHRLYINENISVRVGGRLQGGWSSWSVHRGAGAHGACTERLELVERAQGGWSLQRGTGAHGA